MDANIVAGLDARDSEIILGEIEIELAQEVTDVNMGFFAKKQEVIEAKPMNETVEALRRIRGARGRVRDDVLKTAKKIEEMENHLKELNNSAAAPQLKEMEDIKAELNETINYYKDFTNGGPALDPTKPAK